MQSVLSSWSAEACNRSCPLRESLDDFQKDWSKIVDTEVAALQDKIKIVGEKH